MSRKLIKYLVIWSKAGLSKVRKTLGVMNMLKTLAVGMLS